MGWFDAHDLDGETVSINSDQCERIRLARPGDGSPRGANAAIDHNSGRTTYVKETRKDVMATIRESV